MKLRVNTCGELYFDLFLEITTTQLLANATLTNQQTSSLRQNPGTAKRAWFANGSDGVSIFLVMKYFLIKACTVFILEIMLLYTESTTWRAVQPLDISGPHQKKSCLRPHVKYTVTRNHKTSHNVLNKYSFVLGLIHSHPGLHVAHGSQVGHPWTTV